MEGELDNVLLMIKRTHMHPLPHKAHLHPSAPICSHVRKVDPKVSKVMCLDPVKPAPQHKLHAACGARRGKWMVIQSFIIINYVIYPECCAIGRQNKH